MSVVRGERAGHASGGHHARPLTAGEWTELSQGLASALRKAGVEPLIRAKAHPGACIAAIWRGSRPIMAVGRTIWWPDARPDLAGDPMMAVLQHELQHVLDYAEGRLSPTRYLVQPRHWTYNCDVSRPLDWNRLGAEQRASLAEQLWRCERDDRDTITAGILRNLIPWARDAGSSPMQ